VFIVGRGETFSVTSIVKDQRPGVKQELDRLDDSAARASRKSLIPLLTACRLMV
jgi:hypothetical protein